MKKQETQSESGSMSEELGDVLSRFKAWQATNGRKSESEGTDVDTSWKLVYGQALDSISQLGSSVELSTPAPSLISPALVSPFLVSPALVSPSLPPQSLVPLTAPSLMTRTVEDSVTDTVSLSTRGPRPANISEFLTPSSEPIIRGENGSPRIEEAFPARSMKPASAPSEPDLLYFRPAAFSVTQAAASTSAVQKPQVEERAVPEVENHSASPRHQAPARARATLKPEPATRKPASHRRQETAPSAGNAMQKAALLKQKATEACSVIAAYLEQSENEVQRLRGKANDLRLDMDAVRCSVLSITQLQAAQQPADSVMSKKSPAQTLAMVPTPADIPVPASVPAYRSLPSVATLPSFSTRVARRLLGLVGIASGI